MINSAMATEVTINLENYQVMSSVTLRAGEEAVYFPDFSIQKLQKN
jgi:hypothetical protein